MSDRKQITPSEGLHNLTFPCVRTKTCALRSFAYQGPATWNELPFDLTDKDSLSTFKKALKEVSSSIYIDQGIKPGVLNSEN